MRRLALVLVILAFPATAHAAELRLSPSDFSPAERTLRVEAALPKAERVGLQLATPSGRALGWITEPQRRRYLTLRWNGRLRGARVPDGRYLVRLVQGDRVVAATVLRIDRTPPRITRFSARNRDRQPFHGDTSRVTTISPNGDGLRESAKIGFTLSERARVHIEVTRTVRYNFSARPKQSKPGPRFEVDAGRRTPIMLITNYKAAVGSD